MEFKDGMDVAVLVESYTHDHLVALRVEVTERMVSVRVAPDPHLGQMAEQRALEFPYELHLLYFSQGIRHRIATRIFMDHRRIDLITMDRSLAPQWLGRDLKVHEEIKKPNRQSSKLRLVN